LVEDKPCCNVNKIHLYILVPWARFQASKLYTHARSKRHSSIQTELYLRGFPSSVGAKYLKLLNLSMISHWIIYIDLARVWSLISEGALC
jgi:hypothetical protein